MEEKGAVRLRKQRKFAPSFLRNAPMPLSIQPLRRYNRPNISVLLSESKRKTSHERFQRRGSCIKATDSAVTPALGVGWELIPLFPSHVSRLSPPAHCSSRASSTLSHARVSIRNVRFQEDIASVLLRNSNYQAVDIESRQSPDGVSANYPSPTPSYRRLPRKILPEKPFFPSKEFPTKPTSLPPKLFQNASLRALAKSTISTSSKQQ